ncbi:UDP-N-acetyl-D-glucosamine dehydrogenase, partial [Acinetobacter baumannii]|nr:UDP-N-acetyl-D-glucosamine dehydrogenase [Acinetobacter baumannii]
GNKKFKIKNTPKVVGGTTENSLEISTLLYQSIVEQVVPVTSTEVAEMSKLLENTFRSINIAFINEMAILCEQMGIDIWETIQASETK